MFKKIFIAPLAALLVAGAAHATSLQTLTLRNDPQLSDQGLRAEIDFARPRLVRLKLSPSE